LARAIAATFALQQTAIPANLVDALTPDFAEDPLKHRQWAAFVSDLAPFLVDAEVLSRFRSEACSYSSATYHPVGM
jgi:hypothetical protein